MGDRPTCEITERRQACNRINELKSKCKYLTGVRDNLSNRLSELNKVADQLIAEKSIKKYDPHLKIDLTSYHINAESSKSSKYHREQKPTSTTTTTDLTVNYDASSRRNQNAFQKSSSDAFKIKLSQCLLEIAPKAKEILELGEHLYNSDFEK